ncbi:hypothetical protein [Microbacterium allomyrinae]|uniref:Uncharacterized protein n=1 Tax=Microbacterium allomyrinae TaxID=2830666 RepID=A0A9X1LVU5_9MICO|nr:hypothetical protein [Microbacterium allomyrinae]MCC2032731.1 hypothetical protein [Microbacterium allomyrinae]
MFDPTPTTSPAQELAIVARELAVIGDRIADAVTNARGLSAATDWQAKAATAYHEKADAWAGAVSSLLCLAETARLDAARARDRVALQEAAPDLQLFAPAARR